MSQVKCIKLSMLFIVIGMLAACGNGMKFDSSFANSENRDFSSPDFDSTFPGDIEDSFVASDSSAIDILFVDDDSPSMANDHQNILSKFHGFMNELAGIDWRIAITTTNTDSGSVDGRVLTLNDGNGKEVPGRLFIDPSTKEGQASFEKSIKRNANGSGHERPIMAALHALQKRSESPNVSFFRAGVPLAVVIISDENENSNAYGRNGTKAPAGHPNWSIEDEPVTLVNYANSIQGMKLTVHAIAIPPGDTTCLQAQRNELSNKMDAYEGTVYAEAVSRTGGVFGSICSQDFVQTLSVLGQGVKGQITSFMLRRQPNPKTVRVSVSPKVPNLTWTVSGNKVTFNKVLPAGTSIRVKYIPL